MTPLEARGWVSAACDALHIHGRDHGSATARLLLGLVVHERLTHTQARSCVSRVNVPVSRQHKNVIVSTLRGLLRDIGMEGIIHSDECGYWISREDSLRIDAFVRAVA